MVTRIPSAVLSGISGCVIDVEVDISSGFPAFNFVGLPDTIIKESKERIRAAIKNSNLEFPDRRLTINFVPANIKKDGSQLDLPIALALLSSIVASKDINHIGVLGELSLTGEIIAVKGAIPLLLALVAKGINHVMLPKANLAEAKLLKDIVVYPVENLIEAYHKYQMIDTVEGEVCQGEYSLDVERFDDFAEIAGQEQAKRVLEIAACGGHNVLLMGVPGSGKSMLAKRFNSIFPPLEYDEIVELTKIYSFSHLAKFGIVGKRPFRSPHHTISAVSLCGGGTTPQAGEISLAHKGVLFLDELPEFRRSVIESLRQPIEDKKISISRRNFNVEFPCDFSLIAAFNPCPCGFNGDKEKECTCSAYQIRQYHSKLSGPIIDRFDLQLIVPRVSYEQLRSKTKAESSEKVRARVSAARKIQQERYQDKLLLNSNLSSKQIKQHCKLSAKSESFLERAYKQMKLSARGLSSVLKVSRSIADLAGKEQVEVEHLAEALQYRRIDKEILQWK